MPVLYAFTTDARKRDPKTDVRLSLDAVDGARVHLLHQLERALGVVSGACDPGAFAVEVDVDVYDRRTKKIWRVRTADCGAGCRCAALARPIEPAKTKDAKMRRKIGRMSITKTDITEYLRDYRADRAALRRQKSTSPTPRRSASRPTRPKNSSNLARRSRR